MTRLFATELLRDLYLGILNREPDPQGTAAYIGKPNRICPPVTVITSLIDSEEFQRRSFARFAPDVVRSLYRGILGREAEPGGLDIYTQKFIVDHKLDGVVSSLIGSDEFRRKNFAGLSLEDLVKSFYRAILKRNPETAGLNRYKSLLSKTRAPELVLNELIDSPEFHRNYAALDRLARANVIAQAGNASDVKTWAFIHILKTGGTSIQNLLAASVPAETLYKEHDDTLARRGPDALAPYSVFAGHFNYDSLAYIPRKSISLLTFVREPVDRLYSYHNFLRAHEPNNAMYGKFHRAANTMDMESFFQDSEISISFDIWNQMTWAIMGARQWEAWQLRLGMRTGVAGEDFIDTVARPAIRQRLREFTFIGLQDDFDRSVRTLCDLIGVPQPEVVPADNSLVSLMNSKAPYKRELTREPITASCRAVLERLVQLDRVLYEEAKVLHLEQLAQPGRSQSIAVPTTPALSNPEPAAGALTPEFNGKGV
jgi:hypothetical protein